MQKNKTNPIRPFLKCGLLLCLFLVIIPCHLHAQDIDFTAGCPNGAYTLPDATVDVAISPSPINAVNTPGGAAATMSIQYVAYNNGLAEIPDCFMPPCTSPYTIFGVTITTSGGTVTVDGTPDNTAEGFTIIFTLRATVGVSNCDRTFNLPIGRQPVDLMLVLDNSPSMLCCTDIDDPTCVSCATPALVRMTNLKQAVDVFFNLGSTGNYFLPADRFGAVIFSGTIDNSNSTYTSDPLALNTFIQGIGTSGGTCLGGGLLEGIDQMTSQSQPNRKKSLILFTDGEQNYNPMLVEDGLVPAHFEGGDLAVSSYNPAAPNPPYGTCMIFPTSPPTFNSAFRDSAPGIKISTIGFKVPPGPANTLLSNLANDVTGPGGTTNIGNASPFDFTTFFTNSFVELLSGSSPQIVGNEVGTTQVGTNTIQFVTNDSISKVSFILIGGEDEGNNLRFRVKKNGNNVTRLGRIVDKDSYRLWHINFPVNSRYEDSTGLEPGGSWELEVVDSKPGVNYMATCIVDDHKFDFDTDFGNPGTHSIGDTILLTVSLNYNGDPVTDAEKIVVEIERSSDDGGTLLATLPIPEKIHSVLSSGNRQDIDPGYNNLGQLKHYTLIKTNPSYVEALKIFVDSVVLSNNGDGTYSAEYTPEVTGAHKFTFLINGKRLDIGEYHRTRVKSSVVRITNIDLSSKFFDVEAIKDDGTIGYKFTMLLKDASGLFLGPAFGSAIELESSTGTFGSVVDNLDGSYTVTLSGLSGDLDPEIKVSINGAELYQGNASQFGTDEASRFWTKWWFWLTVILLVIIVIRRLVR